ncbi:MAG: ATP synthase F1 subunit delta [Planctomycetota bacterium]
MASVANRYSEALLCVCRDEGSTREVDADLQLLALALEEPHLRQFLDNPEVPRARKEAVLGELLGSQGRAGHATTSSFLRVLFDRGRQGMLGAFIAAFHRRALEERGEVEGVLSTALAIPEDELAALRETLARLLGRKVVLSVEQDESLLGGFRALIGDRLFDASLRGQLEKLGRRLKGVPIGGPRG